MEAKSYITKNNFRDTVRQPWMILYMFRYATLDFLEQIVGSQILFVANCKIFWHLSTPQQPSRPLQIS